MLEGTGHKLWRRYELLPAKGQDSCFLPLDDSKQRQYPGISSTAQPGFQRAVAVALVTHRSAPDMNASWLPSKVTDTSRRRLRRTARPARPASAAHKDSYLIDCVSESGSCWPWAPRTTVCFRVTRSSGSGGWCYYLGSAGYDDIFCFVCSVSHTPPSSLRDYSLALLTPLLSQDLGLSLSKRPHSS